MDWNISNNIQENKVNLCMATPWIGGKVVVTKDGEGVVWSITIVLYPCSTYKMEIGPDIVVDLCSNPDTGYIIKDGEGGIWSITIALYPCSTYKMEIGPDSYLAGYPVTGYLAFVQGRIPDTVLNIQQ